MPKSMSIAPPARLPVSTTQSLNANGTSGPISDFRPDLPGRQGQPFCESVACTHLTRTIRPGMHYRVRDIYIFHQDCDSHTMPTPESRAVPD